jgi:hypothetical protein
VFGSFCPLSSLLFACVGCVYTKGLKTAEMGYFPNYGRAGNMCVQTRSPYLSSSSYSVSVKAVLRMEDYISQIGSGWHFCFAKARTARGPAFCPLFFECTVSCLSDGRVAPRGVADCTIKKRFYIILISVWCSL